MVHIVDNWPYTDLHNINLDWILEQIKTLGYKMDTLEGYFPRISDWNHGEWDIDHAYDPNEIVTNGNDIYMAKTNVPAGVNINNTDFWLLVGTDSYITDKVDKSGDTMTGELILPRVKVDYNPNPTVEFDDNSQIVGALYVRSADNAAIFREFKIGQVAFHEDYRLPVPTEDAANKSYEIISSKHMIPWQSAATWLDAVAAAKMDILICFSIAVGTTNIRLDVNVPVVELDDTYRFHFSPTAYVSGTTYYAQARAKLDGLDYANVYDGTGTQVSAGVTTTIYYR